MDRKSAPSLLPVLRSQQQGEILALLLGDPDLELSLTEISARTSTPHPSVYREIERAERAGLVTTRKVGNTRLVRANTASPYYDGLAEVLVRAFGVPAILAETLNNVDGIAAAYIYGSWAARHAGQPGQRPVGDIDVLILGDPDRDQLYDALSTAEQRLGRSVEATIRDPGWLESGTGAFHDTVTSRPLVGLNLEVPRRMAGTPKHDQQGLLVMARRAEALYDKDQHEQEHDGHRGGQPDGHDQLKDPHNIVWHSCHPLPFAWWRLMFP